MIYGVSLSWLMRIMSKKRYQRVVSVPRMGVDSAFLEADEFIICTSSPKERAWMELLWVAMTSLQQTGLETLLGLNKAGRRVFLYHQIKGLLSEETRMFWDGHEETIRNGLLVDASWEQRVQWFGYTRNGLRWKRLAPLFFRRQGEYDVWKRIQERRGCPWLFPWREEALLHGLPAQMPKSILSPSVSVALFDTDILSWIQAQPDQSVDVLLLWDGIEDSAAHWSDICRVVRSGGNVLLATTQRSPKILDIIEKHVVYHSYEAHFRYECVYWLQM